MAKREKVTHLLGVDGDEEANTVTYWYGVFYADEFEDIGRDATPVREFATVVKTRDLSKHAVGNQAGDGNGNLIVWTD